MVGLITPVSETTRPTSELINVDLPAPVDPPITANNGASRLTSLGST